MPTVNRSHTIVDGDTSLRATFVATNVAPQMITVPTASAIAMPRDVSGLIRNLSLQFG
jgi:hypothetical protein